MKNKIFTNINMPPQNQNQQIRNQALQYLEYAKSNLNKLSYLSLKRKIKDKRIDAVKRISDKLRVLRYSKLKNVKQADIKKVIEKVQKSQSLITKLLVKNSTTEIFNPNPQRIYDSIKNMTGSVRVMIVDDGEVIRTIVLDLDDARTKIYEKLFFMVGYDSDVFTEHPDAKVIITKSENITAERIAQAYKQGITNCVLKPIIEFFKMKTQEALSKQTIRNYNVRLNKANKLEMLYRESGVKEKNLQSICDELQIDIEIDQPFQKKHLHYKSNKKALRTFRFINTKLNHIDLNEAFNKEPIYITTEELQEKYKEFCKGDTYFTYTRGNDTITSITTLYNSYKCKKDYNDFVNEFENKTGLSKCKLDDFKDKNLSQYVRQGTHFTGCVDFKPMVEDDDEELDTPIIYENYNHSDMKNAYLNYYMCKYYKGFLGKITDFRKTDKIVGLGYYTITNIALSDKIEKINNKMKLFKNGNVYPSPVLEYLKDRNCKFDIIEGCWGTNLDFSMKEDKWNDKENGTKYYCKYVGTMYHYSEYQSFYMRGDEDYIKNMISVIDYDTFDYYREQEDKGEVRIKMKKKCNFHLSHICGFVVGYTLLNLLEQIEIMNIEDIIRVCVDGIYHYNEYPLMNVFRNKEEPIKENVSNYTFISNYEKEYDWICDAEYKDFHLKELHTGCGGGGKTTKQGKDKGNIKMLYVAPSWKLARNKQEEFNCDVNVWYNLCSNDPEIYYPIMRNYNVIIVDEVSMLNDLLKHKIFKRYSMCKIIMCGDIGFQLGGFKDPNSKMEYIPFKKEGFDYYEEHNTNYRVEDKRLLFLLNQVRKLLGSRPEWVRDFVINNFDKLKQIENYNVKDMILVGTHNTKNKYTEQFKHLNKYTIKNNTQKFSNGQIVYEEPTDKSIKYIQQHAYTTHSIQGETARNNLYIVMSDMFDAKMIYTALSRAKHFHQIKLII
jgi:hypothetical protein